MAVNPASKLAVAAAVVGDALASSTSTAAKAAKAAATMARVAATAAAAGAEATAGAAPWTAAAVLPLAADVFMVFGTAPGWLMQQRDILRTGSAAGFSWQSCVLLLACYTLRVGYYFGAHFHVALLLQCFVMITVVLSIVAAIADVPDATVHPVRAADDGTDDERDVDDTAAGGGSSAVGARTGAGCCARIRRAFSSKWAGGRVYFGFVPWGGDNTRFVYVVYAAILATVCVVCARQLPSSPLATSALGFLALGVEATVVLPQVYLTETKRSVEGLSRFLVATWFVMCGVAQFLVDIFIVGQFLRFRGSRGGGSGAASATHGASASTSMAALQQPKNARGIAQV